MKKKTDHVHIKPDEVEPHSTNAYHSSNRIIFLIFMTNNIANIQRVYDTLFSEGKLPVDAEVFKTSEDNYCKACIKYITTGIFRHVRVYVEPLENRESSESRTTLLNYLKHTCEGLDIHFETETLPNMTCAESPRTQEQKKYEEAFARQLESIDVRGERQKRSELVSNLFGIEESLLSILSIDMMPSGAIKGKQRSREQILAIIHKIYQRLHLILQREVQSSGNEVQTMLLNKKKPYENSMLFQLYQTTAATKK